MSLNWINGARRYHAPAFFLAVVFFLASPVNCVVGQTGYDPTARRGAGFNPLAPAAPARPSSGTAGPQYDPNDEYLGLPRSEGVDVVFSQCTYCHSAALIMQQGMSRGRWDEVLTWMVEERGMPEPEPEDRKIILDYLTRHFGSAQQVQSVPTTGSKQPAN